MGYAVYEIKGRFCGYGVPSICDFPKCNEEIDRGKSYCCGGEPRPDKGCGQYFCSKHLVNDFCSRCRNYRPPFPMKPDTQGWMQHMLTDESWDIWRKENAEKVKALSQLSL